MNRVLDTLSKVDRRRARATNKISLANMEVDPEARLTSPLDLQDDAGPSEVALLAGEKYNGESKRAILACNDYLRMGPIRSLAELIRRYKSDREQDRGNAVATASIHTIYGWAGRFNWEGRAEMYDARTDSEKTAVAAQVLETGLALSYNRVIKLKLLADRLEGDIFKGRIWLDDVKQIGNGKYAQRVDLIVFNRGLVEQYRGILDDLAKETGGRVQKTEDLNSRTIRVTIGKGGGE